MDSQVRSDTVIVLARLRWNTRYNRGIDGHEPPSEEGYASGLHAMACRWRVHVDRLDSLYRLQTFQLGRLNHALAQRDRAETPLAKRLADACVAHLYISCVDAGVGPQARVLIDTYQKPTTPVT